MTNKDTKFYKHYKNKPYRYINIVRHSETLDEMVLYESLYENNLGNLWVRPKEMFFETIHLNGIEIRRFRPIEFKFDKKNNLTEKDKEIISSLCTETIGYFNLKKFESKLDKHNNIFFIIAYDEDTPIGFKVGFAQDDYTFYSWIGGVLPKYRKLGVASQLIEIQHNYCTEQNYKIVETKIMSKFTSMLALNLKYGFEIVGTYLDHKKQIKIILQKAL